jgi:3-oxoacyl-[acyl-carrier protein] reductase
MISRDGDRAAELAGQVALVTGGSGGIGAALCRRLADEGATVAIGYGRRQRPAADLVADIESRGGRAAAFGADLADPDAPYRLVDDVEAALGPVALLVANHGLGRQVGYEDVDAAHFDQTMAINLRAPFLLARRVLPGMRQRGFGRILLMSSVAAFRGGIIGPDYAASKAGLHAIAHFLAPRVAADGVTVNALAPGLIDTPMLPGDRDALVKGVPVGRFGTPDEVADLAIAILRNAYVTSKVFSLDGGAFPR